MSDIEIKKENDYGSSKQSKNGLGYFVKYKLIQWH